MIAWLVLAACTAGDDTGADAPPIPEILDVAQVVPGDAMPAPIVTQAANNNLDIVDHDGRLFMAFRTAPSHFASSEAWLYVVSTADEATWRYEGGWTVGSDLREPRFLSVDGRLWMYYAILGTDPLDFEPQATMRVEYRGEADWTEPEEVFDVGFIPWRAKAIDGAPWLLGYTGGENIYDVDGGGVQVSLFTSEDAGESWVPVSGDGVVTEGGGSETAFAAMDDGSLLAVQRNELGDETGWGSKICKAPADDWGDWTCASDPKKYDSPLMFRHGADAYLIGRRNLNETGDFDIGCDPEMDAESCTLYLSADYWIHPKRCSVWRVDPDALAVEFLVDLPSRGDTCFPGLVERGGGEYLVYNYSSPIDGDDVDWITGQNGDTNIYRQVLAFSE